LLQEKLPQDCYNEALVLCIIKTNPTFGTNALYRAFHERTGKFKNTFLLALERLVQKGVVAPLQKGGGKETSQYELSATAEEFYKELGRCLDKGKRTRDEETVRVKGVDGKWGDVPASTIRKEIGGRTGCIEKLSKETGLDNWENIKCWLTCLGACESPLGYHRRRIRECEKSPEAAKLFDKEWHKAEAKRLKKEIEGKTWERRNKPAKKNRPATMEGTAYWLAPDLKRGLIPPKNQQITREARRLPEKQRKLEAQKKRR